jgi:type I restriction enzyme S subunit
MPRASWEFLSTIPLPTPPLSEQVAVADFLDLETAKIDALVAAQRRLMTLVAEKRRAVVSHAVTRGLNTRAPIKSSGIEWIGDIPMHWSVQRLKYLADIRTGIAKGKDHGSVATVEVPYLRVANVQDGFVDLADVAMMPVPTGDVERFKLREGDVLMNEGGDFDKLGRGAVWRGQVDPCVTQNHVFAVRPLDVESEWLAAYTGSASAQFYFMTRSKQSTNLASISSTNIMELPVVVPPKSERAAILEFIGSQIAALDGLNTSALRTMDLLLERRAALITAAVTGQIDVRHAVATMAVA